MSDISYSILIPTRNRPETAECLVRYLLGFFPDDFEVVIQDCGAAGQLSSALADVIRDPRLRYEHTGRLVSMTENWNRGISRCRGEFVSVLGDDDGVTHELPQIIAWMESQGVDALANNSNAGRYYWPEFLDASKAGTYDMYRHTCEVIEYRSEQLLAEQLRVFGYSNVRTIPMVYAGIVRRRWLLRIAEATGHCFEGYTPDIYSGHFLAAVVPSTHWVDFPVFTPGVCAQSNAAAAFHGESMKSHTEEFESVDWPGIVPEGSIVQVLCAEGLVRALNNAGRQDLVARMKWPDFYLLCMLHDRAYRWQNMKRYWSATNRVLGWSEFERVVQLAVGLGRRIRGKLTRRAGYYDPNLSTPVRDIVERFRDVKDISDLDRRQAEALARQAAIPPWRQQARQVA